MRHHLSVLLFSVKCGSANGFFFYVSESVLVSASKKFPSSRRVIEMFHQPERALSSPEGLILKRDTH